VTKYRNTDANDLTQIALCDLLKEIDKVSFERVSELLKGRASPLTIDAVQAVKSAIAKFETACVDQYGADDNLTEIEIFIMHNDPREPDTE
jgi:hypothetical protein